MDPSGAAKSDGKVGMQIKVIEKAWHPREAEFQAPTSHGSHRSRARNVDLVRACAGPRDPGSNAVPQSPSSRGHSIASTSAD